MKCRSNMRIIHKEAQDGFVQITADAGGRFYRSPDGEYYDSVTTVLQSLPPDPGLIKWLKENGTNADAMRDEAAERGSIIHSAIDRINQNKEVRLDTKFANANGFEREMTLDEVQAVMGYLDAKKALNLVPIRSEFMCFDKQLKVAGTVDIECTIGGVSTEYVIESEPYLVDVKTGTLTKAAALQLSAYRKALGPKYKNHKLAVLQVGPKLRTKKNWRLTELEYDIDTFKHVLALHRRYNTQTTLKTVTVPEVLYAPMIATNGENS